MSELISGKEAKLAWANDIEIEYMGGDFDWIDLTHANTLGVFEREDFKFRQKPKTIAINGIEVPAPFEPKLGERYYVLQPCNESGWMGEDCVDMEFENTWNQFGAWRTEEEIKQVVSALRSVFKGGV